MLRSQTHSLAQHFCSRWHVAYCSVASSRAAGVMRMGQLPHSHSSGEVVLSPDIHCAVCTASITPERSVHHVTPPKTLILQVKFPCSYFDDVSSQNFRVDIAFQVSDCHVIQIMGSISTCVYFRCTSSHKRMQWRAVILPLPPFYTLS